MLPASPFLLQVGDRVQGRFHAGKVWVDGKVIGVNTEEANYFTFDVRYDNGERETRVEAVLLRLVPEAIVDDAEAAEIAASEAHWVEGMFHVGEQVEARLQGGSEWLPGVIKKIAADHTYEIMYRTGLKETGVEGFLVRYPLAPGAKVEAHFRGGKKWFNATIKAVRDDGSFDIVYEDGDEEAGVKPSDVRRPGDESVHPPGQPEVFAPGDKVEVRYQGLSDWIPGVVSAANPDGTYSVEFENIIAEAAVRPEHIRRLPAEDKEEGGNYHHQRAPSAAGNGQYVVGQPVEARFRGGKKWFAGKITAVNTDGSYDVRYLDGDSERGLDASMLRVPASEDGPLTNTVTLTRGMSTYELGDAIEVRFPFAIEYLPGRVIAVNRDGTYDVRFEDGNKDSHVHPKYIKRRKGTPKVPAPPRPEPRFTVAQAVEARVAGSSEWRPAQITGVDNGMYAVKYQDDGPSSSMSVLLAQSLLRLPSAARELRKQAFAVGDTVEAMHALGETYYVAKVVGVHGQGAYYDVRYTDGDLEAGVSVEFLRAVLPPEEAEPEYDTHDNVDVRLHDKWVPARVRRVNQDHRGKFYYDVVTLKDGKSVSRLSGGDLRKVAEEAAASEAKSGSPKGK